MGSTSLNGRSSATRLDPLRPEVLVYQPTRAGGYRLAAVEYVTFQAGQTVLGPADEHRPGGQSLWRPGRVLREHAWIWQGNPNGIFADWNPSAHLPRRGRQRRLTSRSRAACTGRAREGPAVSLCDLRGADRLGDGLHDRLRPTVATHVAISARRLTPSLARMCSTCALAVFGAIDELARRSRRSSGPSAISRATSNSRIGQRSPRLVVEAAPAAARASSSARARSGSLPSAAAVAPDVGQDARQRRRTGSSASGNGRGRARPGRLPDPPALLPATDRALERLARRGQRSRRQTDEPVRVTERRPGDRVPAGRCPRTRANPTLGVIRPSRGDQAPGSGHDERDEKARSPFDSAIDQPSSQRASAHPRRPPGGPPRRDPRAASG